MRLPLVAAAALAAVTLPVAPSHAAIYPVCAAAVAAPARPTASCSAGNTPFQAIRLAYVVVEVGAVDATLTCYNPWTGNSTDTKRVYSGNPMTLRASEYNSCTLSLASVAPTTVATGVTYPTPVIYTVPPPPAS